MSSNSAILTVRRDSPADIQYRENVVYLDGKEIGSLRFGESVRVEIAPGDHTLKVSNRVRSKSVPFTVEQGEPAAFRVGNIGSGCYRFFAEMLQAGVPHILIERLEE